MTATEKILQMNEELNRKNQEFDEVRESLSIGEQNERLRTLNRELKDFTILLLKEIIERIQTGEVVLKNESARNEFLQACRNYGIEVPENL